MAPSACLEKSYLLMDWSQQWETPPSGPVNALLWRNPRLIKISLLPSVSVLAFLFLLVLGEKDQMWWNLKAPFSSSTACASRSYCWDHKVCLNPPKAAGAHHGMAALGVHVPLGRFVLCPFPAFLQSVSQLLPSSSLHLFYSRRLAFLTGK